jgi:hypothetical protein
MEGQLPWLPAALTELCVVFSIAVIAWLTVCSVLCTKINSRERCPDHYLRTCVGCRHSMCCIENNHFAFAFVA